MASPQVLIVESYPDLRAGIVATLERVSFACDAVATPEDAAIKLREHEYSYFVVDLDSPGPTAALVSSLAPSANVILISDEDPRDPRTNSFTLLRKPFSRDELLSRLGALPVA